MCGILVATTEILREREREKVCVCVNEWRTPKKELQKVSKKGTERRKEGKIEENTY